MDRLAAMLLAVLITIAPIGSAIASACSCDVGEPTSHAVETDGCCSPPASPSDEPAPDRDESSNTCECPMPCCGVKHSPSAVTASPRTTPTKHAVEFDARVDQQVNAAAHLDRLKRPPRSMPSS
ncbi:MAG: hypothetical protein AAF297_04835 [Planctomycetota bacterium]